MKSNNVIQRIRERIKKHRHEYLNHKDVFRTLNSIDAILLDEERKLNDSDKSGDDSL